MASHTTEQWAGGSGSLLYPGINSYLPPTSLKSLLMLLGHQAEAELTLWQRHTSLIRIMIYFPGRIGPTAWASDEEPEP